MSGPEPDSRSGRLRELACLFLKLGLIGFGGPAAHIAMMEEEVVRRRRWVSREQFLDLLGATYLIPGPNSTEMAIHLGHRRAGAPGLVVAGVCFILPAMILVTISAWSYVALAHWAPLAAVLYGVKPVILGIVLQSLWSLGHSAARTAPLLALGLACAGLWAAGVHELLLLAGAGAVTASLKLLQRGRNQTSGDERDSGGSRPQAPGAGPVTAGGEAGGLWTNESAAGMVARAGTATAAAAGTAAVMPFGLWPLFWFFLKVGSVLYGSGYVLLAFLRADLVERWHWLTESQLLDAIAVGQITPGPVFTTATFVGYQLGGLAGALVATLGIFLPAFFFVAVSGPLVPRLRASPVAGAALDGINVASLALMGAVTVQLARSALTDGLTFSLAVISAAVLVRFRINSAWLVAGGAVVGLGVRLVGRTG